jgi:hypothetical protein
MENVVANHTGNELKLMLQETKPLSMFYDDANVGEKDCLIPTEEFDKFVALGIFKKAEQIFDLAFDPSISRHQRVRYVLYCLKGEEWRMNAMFLALKTRMAVDGYDEGIERIIGSLLGYPDDEISRYVAARTCHTQPKADPPA